jgi:urease accessory protein
MFSPLTSQSKIARAALGDVRPYGSLVQFRDGAEDWHAQLRVDLERRDGGTILARSMHEGPLRVQRPFYPEGRDGPCHIYVLHPPGGVVSGDRLLVDVRAGEGSEVLLTTPGATKLYRARGDADATLVQRFAVGEGARVEWLPPETIAYDGTAARVSTEVELAETGCYVGWEILCLGRPAAGERLTRGELRTSLSVRRAGRLTYFERGQYKGGDALLSAPWGLFGHAVLATLVVASPRATQAWVETLREAVSTEAGRFAVTLVSGVLIARFLGDSTLVARQLFERAYAVIRPLYAGRVAHHPRIWST